ncbi:WGR domain-containing protein [Rhizobium sp. SGZ-381]|uniref:WGR domain-containing protein n=1 Tax=Rhizobium sp. SGZ-381 TaxID=3342800 RepID=UPI00366B57FA
MTEQRFHAHLAHRIDPSRNMARFYHVAIDVDLFGEICLTRSWGRIGTLGRDRQQVFDDWTAAAEAMDQLVSAKRRRGYRSTA